MSLSRVGATECLYTVSPGGSVFKCLIFIRVTVVLEKEMATHSSTFAWEPLGQRSLVGYSPWGRRVGHTHTPVLLDEGWLGSTVTSRLLVPSAMAQFSSKVTF